VKLLLKERPWLIYLLLFITYYALMPAGGHWSDMGLWRFWALHIYDHGLGQVYQSGTDYPPIYHYFLWIYTELQGTRLAVENHIGSLKYMTLVFDFVAGAYLVRLLRARVGSATERLALSLLFFLNIAYFYNTVIWGQVDGILACFIIASVYYAHQKRIVPALLFIVLATSFKIQAIVFLPLVGLMLVPVVIEKFSWRRLVIWICSVAVFQSVILLPFWLAGDLNLVFKVIFGSAERYPVVSMNAYNYWYWFFDEPMMTSDKGIRSIGLAFFFGLSAVALLPVVRNVYFRIARKENSGTDLQQLLLAGALCGLIFFFFNTQMHERYSHPAILLLAGYALLSGRFIGYLLVSIAYFLNMDGVLRHFDAAWLPYDPRAVAIIYLAAIVWLFAELYGLTLPRARPAHSPNSSL